MDFFTRWSIWLTIDYIGWNFFTLTRILKNHQSSVINHHSSAIFVSLKQREVNEEVTYGECNIKEETVDREHRCCCSHWLPKLL